jgi:hypothetical protein
MRQLRTLVGALCALVAVAGCRQRELDPPICKQLVAASFALELDTRVLPFDVWMSVLVQGFDRSTRMVPDDPRDCINHRISSEAAGFGPGDAGRRAPMEQDDIHFSLLGDERLLVWAQMERNAGGDALGPVALVRWVEQGVQIRGIGTLRAPAKRPKLYLEPLDDSRAVLFAEGDVCPRGDEDLKLCERALQLALLKEQIFSPLQVQEGADAPVVARIALSGQREEKGAGGALIRTSLRRKIKVDGGRLVMNESIRVERCDANGEACELDARHDEPRVFVLDGSILRTEGGAWFTLDARPR